MSRGLVFFPCALSPAGDRITSVMTASDLTTSYAYKANNTLATVAKPSGQQIQNSYDQALRLIQETDPYATTGFAYDKACIAHKSLRFVSDAGWAVPDFIGRGLTAGGAREFTLPNLTIDQLQNVTIRIVPAN
jgi:YD repeat-containing protein